MVSEAQFVLFVCTGILAIISMAALYQIRSVPLRTAVSAFDRCELDSREARLIVGGFFAVTFLAVLVAEFGGQGIPILEYLNAQVDQAALHRHGKGSRLQVLGQAFVVAGMMAMYIAVTTKRSRLRAVFGLAAALVPIVGVLKASKADVFLPVLYYAMLLAYMYRARGERLPLRQIAAAAVAVLAVFTVITATRLQGVSVADPVVYSDLIRFQPVTHVERVDDALAIAYGYSALNYQNFSNFVAYSSDTQNWGTSLLRPFYSLLMRGDVPDQALGQINWYFVSPAATVGTYLRDLYAEGGALFCIVGSVIYALFVNTLYLHFRRSGRLVAQFLYISFTFAWVWIFFQNAFAILGFYINAFYILGICSAADWARGHRRRYSFRPMPAQDR
jgi:hypothetical protein